MSDGAGGAASSARGRVLGRQDDGRGRVAQLGAGLAALGRRGLPASDRRGASGSTRSDSTGRCTETGEPCSYGGAAPSFGWIAVTSAPPSEAHAHLAEAAEEDEVLDEARAGGSRPSVPCGSMRTRSGRIIALTAPRAPTSPCAARSAMSPTLSTQAAPSRPAASAPTRFETPRKSATKSVAGSSYISCGGPLCSTRPPFMTATRSLIVSASSWSCVTNTNVMPRFSCSVFSSTCRSLRRRASSAPSGSSSSSTRGRSTSARASATRCCWPPESCPGLRFS